MLTLLFSLLLSLGQQPTLLRNPELYQALVKHHSQYIITKDTVVLLDGQPATIADIEKVKGIITKLVVDGDKVLRLEARSP